MDAVSVREVRSEELPTRKAVLARDVDDSMSVVAAYEDLETGERFSFVSWPQTPVLKGPPGVYTIWRGDEFLYVGISWKEPSTTTTGATKGLWGRLDSHASGRRSGDQFCLYVCDRFVLSSLSTDQIGRIANAELSLDGLTRTYIREHLSYRYATTQTGSEARAIEAAIRKAGLPTAGLPFLNPTGGSLRPPRSSAA